MAEDWVKFHRQLTKGTKRGIPRALRFVLMELSLEAKRLQGAVELPLGMTDEDAVCDILGGNRKEVVEALKAFCPGPDPGDPVLIFDGPPGARLLVFPKWRDWNTAVEIPGASTAR